MQPAGADGEEADPFDDADADVEGGVLEAASLLAGAGGGGGVGGAKFAA